MWDTNVVQSADYVNDRSRIKQVDFSWTNVALRVEVCVWYIQEYKVENVLRCNEFQCFMDSDEDVNFKLRCFMMSFSQTVAMWQIFFGKTITAYVLMKFNF